MKKVIFLFLVMMLIIVSSCENYTVGRNLNRADQNNIRNDELVKNDKIINNLKVEKNEDYKDFSPKNSQMFLLDSSNEEEYIIKNSIDEEGNIKEGLYYKNKLVQDAPNRDRDRPREGDPGIREYFDISIAVDDNNRWVENDEVSVFIYNENIPFFYTYAGTYAFEENHRVHLSDNVNRNGDFDVIMSITNHGRRIIMIKPLFENEITFDLADIQRIETNVWDVCEERETKVVVDELNLRRDSIRGFLATTLNRITNGGEIEEETDNYIYISEDTINQNWQFLKLNYCIERDMGWSATGDHIVLNINNIIYPVDESYRISNNELKQITFNIQDSFIRNNYIRQFYLFYGHGSALFNYPINMIPFRINLFFNEDNFLKDAYFLYSRAMIYGGDIELVVPFERYYNEHELGEIILNVIEKPNELKLYTELSEGFPYPYLRGYLAGDYPFNFHQNFPPDYIRTRNLERGSVNLITPDGNIFQSLRQGDGFFISCNEEGVHERGYFETFECIEGDYIINWSFTNIIKNRDLYLDAIVRYDGESWSIIQQNSRVVNRGGARPLGRRELD